MSRSLRAWLNMIALGVTSAVLYALLFSNEAAVLEISRRGGGWFVVPVVIAFVFSLVHGTFTGLFWDVLGVKARK